MVRMASLGACKIDTTFAEYAVNEKTAISIDENITSRADVSAGVTWNPDMNDEFVNHYMRGWRGREVNTLTELDKADTLLADSADGEGEGFGGRYEAQRAVDAGAGAGECGQHQAA